MKYFCNVCLSDVKKTDEGYFCENCNDIVAQKESQLIPESRTRIIDKDTQTYKKGERVLEKRGGSRKNSGSKPQGSAPKINYNIRMPIETKDLLDHICETLDMTRADVITEALILYSDEVLYEKFDEDRPRGKDVDINDIE